MKTFKHINARTLREANKLLSGSGGKAKLISGGTDLLSALKDKILPEYPEVIVNLKTIPGLDYIKDDGKVLRIGALTKLADIAESTAVKTKYKIMGEAAYAVATPQVRNMATIGGNLCQDVRCWYYRYPHSIGGRILCYLKSGKSCYALMGENRYHSILGGCRVASPPCSAECPGNVDIASYMSLIREGNLLEAARILLKANPIPAITGRVCPHKCETECNRRDLDEAVSIRGIERFLGEYVLDHATEIMKPPQKNTGKKVAIVGSGPAGLAAAYYLRMAGHSVTVFDKMAEAGGMLTYGIPSYRLPKDVVKRVVGAIQGIGVEFKLKADVGKDANVESLTKTSDSVLLATGAWRQRSIGLQGEDLTKSGLDFLINTNQGLTQAPGKKVLVIGGGNVAIDVGITALRLGAKEVTLACLESRQEMPAFPDEIEQALEEGVKLMPSWGPSRVLTANGKVVGMELVCCTCVFDSEGRFAPSYDNTVKTSVEADTVIMAVGQATDLSFLGAHSPLKVERGFVVSDKETQETSLPGVFASGEVASGPASVIEAIAAGRKAAAAIDRYLGGTGEQATGAQEKSSGGFLKFNSQYLVKKDRAHAAKVSLDKRSMTTEDLPALSSSQIETEANRCFNCGCVASSPSDIAVALIALGAKVKVAGPKGLRTILVEDLFGSFRNTLEPGEIVTEVQVPKPQETARQAFQKFRIRKSVDFPIVSVASVITMKDGVCKDARIALGAVAPVAVRATGAEKALKGKAINEETAQAAGEAAVKGAIPLGKNKYKVQITKTLVKRAILS